MIIFIVWKVSISGWEKELLEIFVTEQKAREYRNTLSGGTQYRFEIEKIQIN